MQTYEVTIGGIKHHLVLDAEDAKQYGDRAVPVASNKAATAPATTAKGRGRRPADATAEDVEGVEDVAETTDDAGE